LSQLAFTYQGRPVAYSMANEVLLLYYNKAIFDAQGVNYPPSVADDAWTWDEFVAAAKLLTLDGEGRNRNDAEFDDNDIVTYGAEFGRASWASWMWPVLAESAGGGIVSDDGKTLLLGDQTTISAYQAIADLYAVHGVAPHICAVDPGQWPGDEPTELCEG